MDKHESCSTIMWSLWSKTLTYLPLCLKLYSTSKYSPWSCIHFSQISIHYWKRSWKTILGMEYSWTVAFCILAFETQIWSISSFPTSWGTVKSHKDLCQENTKRDEAKEYCVWPRKYDHRGIWHWHEFRRHLPHSHILSQNGMYRNNGYPHLVHEFLVIQQFCIVIVN